MSLEFSASDHHLIGQPLHNLCPIKSHIPLLKQTGGRILISIVRARLFRSLFGIEQILDIQTALFVMGGEKPDRRGGVKIDHFGRREGLIWLDLQGYLEIHSFNSVFNVFNNLGNLFPAQTYPSC